MKKVIVILGTNASGKTNLAVKLARKFKGEIISADSRQVYQGMDLGTGKEGRKGFFNKYPVRFIDTIPQYLVDIKKPNQQYTVADFQEQATALIHKIIQRNKIPFIVGGTGLYLDAVTKGFIIPQTSKKGKQIRKKLEKQSLKMLLKRLKKLDFKTYRKIDKNNKRRIIRALEVCLITGKKFSELKKAAKPDFKFLKIGLTHPRKKLYQLIDERVNRRIKQGMILEVKKLRKLGIQWKRLDDFGLEYRFIAKYLKGEFSKEEMIEKLKFAIHDFARRQLTWFRRDKEIHWITSQKQAERLIRKFL